MKTKKHHIATKFTVIILIFTLTCNSIIAQPYYRLKANFSIKSKTHDNKSGMILGTVYYDRSADKVVYDISFPNKEIWVAVDTSLITLKNNEVINTQSIPATSGYLFFKLVLTGNLSDYGLENSAYKINTVERQKQKVVTSWLSSGKKTHGKILTSSKNKKLQAIVFYNSKNQIISKQFFENYKNIMGLAIPQKILKIDFLNNKKNYQQITLDNILINNDSDETFYNIDIPKH